MAKATLKCTCPDCGATHYWETSHYNRRMADNWEAYHADEASERLCPACYAKHQAKAHAAETAAAKAAQDAMGFPALTGSEKQVAWAASIRQKAVDTALATLQGTSTARLNDKGRAAVSAIVGKMPTESRWWIDHRDDAHRVVAEEIKCYRWALRDDARRADYMSKLRAAALSPNRYERDEAEALIASYARYERARLAGRTYLAQVAAEKTAAQ